MPVDTKQRKSSLTHVRAGAPEWSPVFKSNRRSRLASSNRRKSNNRQAQRARRRSNVVSCFQCTQQYSIIALTDETGNIKERYAYDAYGAPTILDANGVERATSAENNRYMYTGREWDEDLGLYYYRARMYDPYSERFCSRDLIGYRGGINFYEYVRSQPVTKRDPSGMHFSTGSCVTCEWGERGWFGDSDPVAIISVCESIKNTRNTTGGCSGKVTLGFDIEIEHTGTNSAQFSQGTSQFVSACGESVRLKHPAGPMIDTTDESRLTATIAGGGCNATCCRNSKQGNIVLVPRGVGALLTFGWRLSVGSECGADVTYEITPPSVTGPGDGGFGGNSHYIRCE